MYKTYRSRIRVIVVMAFWVASGYLFGELVFFPVDKIDVNENGALLRATAAEVLYSYSFLEKDPYLCFNAGLKFPLISWLNNSRFETELGVKGGIFARFELFTPSFNNLHSDYLLSMYEDFKINPILWGIAFSHTSSHIGDDYVRLHSPDIIQDTGFESLKVYTRYFGKWIVPELALEYQLNSRPQGLYKNHFSFLTGIRFSLLPAQIPLYFESEAEIFDVTDLPNIGVRMGLYLRYFFNKILLGKQYDTTSREYHEFTITYYYGYSKLGYFSDKRESLLLIGPGFRF